MNLVQSLKNEIANLNDKINDIQSQCNHDEVTVVYRFRSSNGNWDDVVCNNCDKEMTISNPDR